jgi:glycosyltransferase involved in cell wall biosynthesis
MEALYRTGEIPLASIIVNNYNYGRFLAEAIDSALAQTYPRVEVIVADDGSTDDSRDIISAYGDRIIPVLKENGGQASAFNTGFATSRGQTIFFLDSDDVLLPTALEHAAPIFRDPDVVKVHWPLWEIDAEGKRTGDLTPTGELAEGELRELAVREGPINHVNPPTSGNGWSRRFLESVLPMPEAEWKICADVCLMELAPFSGRIGKIPEPQALYRLHGQNNYSARSFDERLKHGLELHDSLRAAASKYCRDAGITVDIELWRQKSWFHRLHKATEEIASLVSANEAFVLVDQDEWGMRAENSRLPIPFLERYGKYWGSPPNDEVAIRELERLRQSGAKFMVFAWPAFWWLEHYASLHRYMRNNYPCVMENERVVVFDLGRSVSGAVRQSHAVPE